VVYTHTLPPALALQGERIIQVVKRKTKFRSTTHPVKVLVNELQLILGIERLRQGPSHILTRAELLPASYGPTLQRKYANADEGGDDDSKASLTPSALAKASPGLPGTLDPSWCVHAHLWQTTLTLVTDGRRAC